MFDVLIRRWWIVALRGVIAMALGVALFGARVETLWLLATFFGVIALADGVFAAGAGLAVGWMPMFLQGIIGLTIGLFALAFPDAVDLWFIPLVVAWAAVTGLLGLVAVAGLRRLGRPSMAAGEWLLGIHAVLSLAFAVVFAWRPGIGSLTGLVGAYALASGAALLAFAFDVRHWPAGIVVSSRPVPAGGKAS
jgi:uncharacterized membrane protein HdeD (DUF308 family)